MLVLAVAELFASRLFRSIVIVSLSKHLLSSLVCWCSAFCHITAACVSGKIHYVIPVPLLFVARCTDQAMRQRHPQPIGGARAGWQRKGSGPLFCFSIVAQRLRVSPPSRLGAVDGLLVPLAHGLMRTPCGEQKRHWYRIMDFATLTSGKAPSSTRAPSKAPCCSATLRRNSFR